MNMVMDDGLQRRLEEVKKRDWWPVALLAEALGKPKMYIYRKAADGKFEMLNDGGYIKITSDSVVRYFSEKHHQIV
jgi:hypothetical protein